MEDYKRVLITKIHGIESIWIPCELAFVGKVLKCKDKRWDGWEVAKVYKTNSDDWEIRNGMIIPKRWTPEMEIPKQLFIEPYEKIRKE